MSNLSFAFDHKVLAYQDIDWEGSSYQRRSILVRAEIFSESKINQCIVTNIEKYNKCHLLGWGQCRKYHPLSTTTLKKTVLVDVFWLKSINYQNRCWVHYSKLGSEANKFIEEMCSKQEVYRQFHGMETLSTHPLAIRTSSSMPQQLKELPKSDKKPIINPLLPIKLINKVEPRPLTLPNTKLPFKEPKKEDFKKLIDTVGFKPTPLEIKKEISPPEPKKEITIEIKKETTLDSLKSLFMVSLTFLESQMMCIKLILDNVLPNMTHFPSKITTLQEIEGFKNDVIQSIQKTFTLPSSVLLSSVFLFGMELGKLKKYWKNRTQKENIDVVKEVIESMKKYSSIIDIVFSQQMKDLIQNIYQKAEIEDSFDMMNEIQTIEDHFIWNNELSNQCQTTFISNGEIKQEYKHILPMFH